MHIKERWKTFNPICFPNLPPTQKSREALHTARWMYCIIHLLEIFRLWDFSSPLFYPSLLGLSPLPNWDPPPLSRQRLCTATPGSKGGGGTLQGVRRWREGVPIRTTGEKASTLSTVAGTVRKGHQSEIFLGSDFYICFFIVINAS
jgi:hypothetical protein